MLKHGHSGARAFPANLEYNKTDLRKQRFCQCSLIPGPALKGRPGMTAEFFRTLLVRRPQQQDTIHGTMSCVNARRGRRSPISQCRARRPVPGSPAPPAPACSNWVAESVIESSIAEPIAKPG
jgi:hypothetical protein